MRAPADSFNALAVEYRAIGELRPYERNARTHSPAQIDQIAAVADARRLELAA